MRKPRRAEPKGADGLTPLQRRFVSAVIRNPDIPIVDQARKAGIRINPTNVARRMLKSSSVRLAIAAGTPNKRTGKLPVVNKEWLRTEMQKLYADPRTPINERVKLLKELGATEKGFYVPTGIEHSGRVGGIEDWVENMGGKPGEGSDHVKH